MKKSSSRVFPGQLAAKAFKDPFLLRVQHHRAMDFGRGNLPAPENLSLLKLNKAQSRQAVYCLGTAAGIVADILDAGAACTAKKLHDAALHGGGFGAGGGKGQGRRHLHPQNRDFFRFVPGFPGQAPLGGNPLFPQKVGGCLFKGILLHKAGQLGPGGGASIFPEGFQDFQGVRLAGRLLLPASVRGQGVAVFCLKPQPSGKHGPHHIKVGTKAPAPEKRRQLEHGGRQHRLLIQHLLHRLEVFLPAFPHLQHHPFHPAVTPAEGNHHPDTGLQVHGGRNKIGIGLVNGKSSRRNSNSCNHKAPP